MSHSASNTESFNLYGLPVELQEMVIEEMHNQHSQTAHGQLSLQFNECLKHLRQVNKRFSQDTRSSDKVRTFEVTQRKLLFDTEELLGLRSDSIEGRAWRASSQLLVNLNVNEKDDGSNNIDLLNWISSRNLSWHDRKGSVLRANVDGSLATVRLWVCSVKAYDEMKARRTRVTRAETTRTKAKVRTAPSLT